MALSPSYGGSARPERTWISCREVAPSYFATQEQVQETARTALAALYREGEVLGIRSVGVEQEVTVRLEAWQADKLRAAGRLVERKAARKETA